ncbi:MFS transporter [Actinocorallia sp. API 0066]|uniref:MFS transporter n=1 Tax=Actinocorallia sp. API 0066 TaxID=2896846 RepID=UPI001E654956|nr:MFS transporter [Actinocorallia sp. API 0066]MCD0453397.1 MFS transporter [Actinocorallia sp. API 0066]
MSGERHSLGAYRDVLRERDFRRLWTGAVISLVGDGSTWIALSWIAVTTGGVGSLTLLGVCFFAPIAVGGPLAGRIVDRFSRRKVLVADSVVRGVVMLSIPVYALFSQVPLGYLYVVAALYGLLKILPIGIVPAVIPELVPKRGLSAAIALESVAASAAGLIGPAVGGALIPLIGAHGVLTFDALTYFVFAGAVLSMRARLDRPPPVPGADAKAAASWRPVVRFLRGDPVMLVITVTFSLFNVAMGMLVVAQPWLAHERLPGGAAMLGVLVSVLAAAEVTGSLIAGALRPARRPMLRIGLLQLVSGGGLLLLLGADPVLVLIGQVACGLPAALLVVSSQAVRYERTPEELRGRTMTLMRTLMLGAVPLGSMLGGLLLDTDSYTATVLVMAAIAGLPGLLSLLVRDHAVTGAARPAAVAAPTHGKAD